MADSAKTATYSIRFDSNAKEIGSEGADSLDALKGAVVRSQDSVRTLSAAMKGLKGSSDEVKSARESLKGQLEAEKGAITSNTLALLKQGTSIEQLAQKEKAAAAAAAKFKAEQEKAAAKVQASVSAAGGPVAALRDRIKTLSEAMSTNEGRSALFAKGLASMVSVAAMAAAAVVALGAALGAGLVALSAWVVETANAQRNLALLREAWTGSATGAQHLGNQIDALAKKIPTPKAELNELAGSLVRALSGTRISGQGIVDTFQAVATAASAMGQQAGAAIEDIIKRSAQFGRVQINPFELRGTGLKFGDVAGQLAKDLGVGVQQAQLALLQGRVKVDDAAKALREALEKRFGNVNSKKMLSLDVSFQRFKEKLQGLTSGVSFEGLLRSVSKLVDLFDTSTITGKNLKVIVTAVGNLLGVGFEGQLPKLKDLFLGAELVALKFLIGVKKVQRSLEDLLGKNWDGKLLSSLFDTGTTTARGFAHEIDGVTSKVEGVVQKARDFSTAWSGAGDKIQASWEGFKDLGARVVDGLIAGIQAGAQRVKDAVTGLAANVKSAFASALGIHSPSLVFEGYGKNTAAGYQRGVDRGAPKAQDAVERMVPRAPAAAVAPAGGGGGKAPAARMPPIQVTVHVDARGATQDAVNKLSSPVFLKDLTRALEEALTMQGLPMQTEPT